MQKQNFLNHDLPAGSLKNKTGVWRNFYPVVDKTKCINCAICEMYCPEGCILQKTKNYKLKANEAKSYYEADLDYCKGCGICPEVCPVKCIKMETEK